MLRISLFATATQSRVILEGRMIATDLTRLRTMCTRLKSKANGRALVIDMKGVTLISQEGENLLLQLINNGTKLRVEGVLAKCLLQQLARRTKKQLSDIIDTSPAENTNVQVLTR
jgi:hypothetical protein